MLQKRSETLQKRPKNAPKTIRESCEIDSKIVQIAKHKAAFILSAGGTPPAVGEENFWQEM